VYYVNFRKNLKLSIKESYIFGLLISEIAPI